jgi:CheY-like chemotaxis protein
MAPPKILLVDDVDFFLEIEKGYLSQTSATVLLAGNGQQALEMARNEHPDLIFMDVNMPLMDGLTCCRKIKDDPTLAKIPVVIVFAQSPQVTEATCVAAGCDGVLRKPVDRKAFLDIGRRLLYAIDRREKRNSCQVPIDFRIDGVSHQGTGIDLSGHGLYVHYRNPVKKHQLLKVVFHLPTVSPEPLEINGRIAWVNQGFPRPNLGVPQGFGVEFSRLTPETAALIQKHLALATSEQARA